MPQKKDSVPASNFSPASTIPSIFSCNNFFTTNLMPLSFPFLPTFFSQEISFEHYEPLAICLYTSTGREKTGGIIKRPGDFFNCFNFLREKVRERDFFGGIMEPIPFILTFIFCLLQLVFFHLKKYKLSALSPSSRIGMSHSSMFCTFLQYVFA